MCTGQSDAWGNSPCAFNGENASALPCPAEMWRTTAEMGRTTAEMWRTTAAIDSANFPQWSLWPISARSRNASKWSHSLAITFFMATTLQPNYSQRVILNPCMRVCVCRHVCRCNLIPYFRRWTGRAVKALPRSWGERRAGCQHGSVTCNGLVRDETLSLWADLLGLSCIQVDIPSVCTQAQPGGGNISV